jgi:glycopeptide antibiotics resistance protein
MRRIALGAFAGLIYTLSATLISLYIYAALSDSRLTPTARMILLCGVAGLVYLAGIILAKKLMPLRKNLIMRLTFSGIFVIYVILVLTFTLFDDYFGRSGFHFIFTASDTVKGMYTSTSINLIPFKNIAWYFVHYAQGDVSTRGFIINMLGNVIAFAPMGLFLPLLLKRLNRLLPFTLFTAGCIVFIEVTQILHLTGFCDIDDLILNLGGACAFYGILHIPAIRRLVQTVTLLEY